MEDYEYEDGEESDEEIGEEIEDFEDQEEGYEETDEEETDEGEDEGAPAEPVAHAAEENVDIPVLLEPAVSDDDQAPKDEL